MESTQQRQRAVVKSILSGDTVILRSLKARPGAPPAERTLGLSGINAPRFGRRGEAAEPYAFESRELLRKQLVGREILFRIDYTTSSGREYGAVFVNTEDTPTANTLESAQMILVREGLARVREDTRRGGKSDESDDGLASDMDSLTALEASAKEARKGVWADPADMPQVEIRYQLQEEPREFVEKYAGVKLPAVVEQVREGSSYRLLLILEGGKIQQYVNFLLSGIKCPAIRGGIQGQPDVVEPFAEEAKYFAESRLLQRDVEVVLEGASGASSVVGTIFHPNGNISEHLVSAGLARIQEWSCPLVTGGAGALRAAEKNAKAERKKLWTNYAPKISTDSGFRGRSFEATVGRIISGDTIMVREEKSGETRKLQLSSVKQAKPKTFYCEEGREFLRKKLIGKRVRVVVDYTKPESEAYEQRDCATIKVGSGPDGGENVAVELVERGLAYVIKHRRDDDSRSSEYDKLQVAELEAQKAGKGVHSQKEPPAWTEPRDASESAAKARQLLPFLQRAGRISAVIDHVVNGSRFRVYVPRENCKLTLMLAGVRSPRMARNSNEQSEPFANEALEYASRKALQRDVEIEIETADKTGGFIGTVWLSRTENLSVKLLEEGLCAVHEYSASMSSYGNQLFTAEQKAKIARKNIWIDYDEAAEKAQYDEGENVQVQVGPNKEYIDCVVSDIGVKGHFYVQIVNEDIHVLERLMKEFSLYHSSAKTDTSWKPKKGEMVSAQYTQDGCWYRARIRRIMPASGEAEVAYVDYGNSEVIPISRLRPLPTQFSSLPPQSHEATLSFIKIPDEETGYGTEACARFHELVRDKQLVANVDARIAGVMHLSLFDPATSTDRISTLNGVLVTEGLATVNATTPYAKANQDVVDALVALQEQAKKSRLGMWEYGDITADEEKQPRRDMGRRH